MTPKGICGTLVKEKKFPEMRPFLLTAMVTVHKGASQEQPRWLVQHYTNPPMDATSTKGFLSVRGVRGTSEEERKHG